MVATAVGVLTIILALWMWRREPRRWMRHLGFAALGAVIAQGLLGGATVLLLLPTPVSVAHACLAQTFFCLTVAIAVMTAPAWRRGPRSAIDSGRPPLRALTAATTAVIFAQLLAGATMRHMGAGLAIPDFPLAFGRLIPPVFTEPIAVHFAHRVGALIVTVLVVVTGVRVLRWRPAGMAMAESSGDPGHDRGWLLRPAVALLILTPMQLALGAFTVWSGMAVAATTAHVAVGAAILGSSLALALRVFRVVEPTRARDAEQVLGTGGPGHPLTAHETSLRPT